MLFADIGHCFQNAQRGSRIPCSSPADLPTPGPHLFRHAGERIRVDQVDRGPTPPFSQTARSKSQIHNHRNPVPSALRLRLPAVTRDAALQSRTGRILRRWLTPWFPCLPSSRPRVRALVMPKPNVQSPRALRSALPSQFCRARSRSVPWLQNQSIPPATIPLKNPLAQRSSNAMTNS